MNYRVRSHQHHSALPDQQILSLILIGPHVHSSSVYHSLTFRWETFIKSSWPAYMYRQPRVARHASPRENVCRVRPTDRGRPLQRKHRRARRGQRRPLSTCHKSSNLTCNPVRQRRSSGKTKGGAQERQIKNNATLTFQC